MRDPKKTHTGGIVPETDLQVRLFTDHVLSRAMIDRLGGREIAVTIVPGERVLNRSDRPIIVERGVGHRTFGMNPGERTTLRGGVIRSRQLMQDPEPVPHPDDGLPDPTNGRPCPGDTRGGCPDEPPRPIPDPSPPRPGEGPVVV